MKKITQLLFLLLTITFFVSCEEDTPTPLGTNYVTFEAAAYTFGVDIGSSNTREVKVYAASVSGSARTIGVSVVAAGTSADPASYTVPTSVTIPAGSSVGTLSITISDTNISSTGETIEIAFDAVAGQFAGSNIVLNVRQVCPTNPIELEIMFDNYSGETSWDLKDGSGAIMLLLLMVVAKLQLQETGVYQTTLIHLQFMMLTAMVFAVHMVMVLMC